MKLFQFMDPAVPEAKATLDSVVVQDNNLFYFLKAS